MATVRQAITPAMKVKCIISRFTVNCGLCGGLLTAEDDIEWDHVHALVHGGAHRYTNLRPVHAECHKVKTKSDIQANAKIKRIRGETKQGPKRAIPSKPFSKVHRPMRSARSAIPQGGEG